MQEYTVPRTGFPPVQFRGELIAEALPPPDKKGRWHELRLFRTEGARLVLAVGYRSTKYPKSNGPRFTEIGHDAADVFDGVDELRGLLDKHRAQIRALVRPHPKSVPWEPDYQSEQASKVTRLYDHLCDALLASINREV